MKADALAHEINVGQAWDERDVPYPSRARGISIGPGRDAHWWWDTRTCG